MSLKIVALRKESVDRNSNPGSTTLTFPGSLSARRAWIEIFDYIIRLYRRIVSLSARRAWIEIVLHGLQGLFVSGRSPQGERG